MDEFNLADIVSSGDSLMLLKALQKRLARQIDQTDSARDVAALSKQLKDVMEMIDGYDKGQDDSKPTVLELVRSRHRKEA